MKKYKKVVKIQKKNVFYNNILNNLKRYKLNYYNYLQLFIKKVSIKNDFK